MTHDYSARYPHATILPFKGKWPEIHESAFIAPGVRVIGDVTIGEGSSVWYNCVLRGDASYIRIGKRTNIQDGSVIHCESDHGDGHGPFPTIIGDDVLVGHMVMMHGCTVQDFGFVGLGSIIMDQCVVETDGMLGAGALLTPGKHIKTRELWTGRPAKMIRMIGDDQARSMRTGTQRYVENAKAHKAEALENL